MNVFWEPILNRPDVSLAAPQYYRSNKSWDELLCLQAGRAMFPSTAKGGHLWTFITIGLLF